MDSRTRAALFGVQFERLVEHREHRSFTLETVAGRFILTRYDNVVTCQCELADPSPEKVEALARRGAVDGVFMISHKLPGKEFGLWLERLLTADLGANAEADISVREPLAAA